MGQTETPIMNRTLVAVTAEPDVMAWRNNTGSAWQGKPVQARIGDMVRVTPGMKILMDARPINFGLVGSGDILGAARGRPLAIEIKTLSGDQRKMQENFERRWTEVGGIYILARSPEEAVRRLRDKLSTPC